MIGNIIFDNIFLPFWVYRSVFFNQIIRKLSTVLDLKISFMILQLALFFFWTSMML